MPDRHSVSSSESSNSLDNYNPILDETIGQFDGAFDLLEDELDTQSGSSNKNSSCHLEKNTPTDSKTPDNSSSLKSEDSCHNDDLMDSFSLILQESETSKKSDRELVADQAVWELQRISQTGRRQRGP